MSSAISNEPTQGVAEKLDPEAMSRRQRHILVVDDDPMNASLLHERLEAEGYRVTTAGDGRAALDLVHTEEIDLVLLDLIMPGLDGYDVLVAMKRDDKLREIPVIMISGLDELNSVAKCSEVGADDYLPKPYKPVLLRARIKSCLEKKELREQEQATYQALVESQKHLAAELNEAAHYVRSLLPEPLKGDVTSEWKFVPSTALGGDSFGYHWLDEDHLAIYLLDVCGHGVGAALLSISAMNVLRSQSLPKVDFLNPGSVLMGLNEAFQMERQNNMYFTIWYGVYSRSERKIVFARGGHPPAVLLTGEKLEESQIVELNTPGLVIGSMPGVKYKTAEQLVPPRARLFLFSDGVYELNKPDGKMWEFGEFVETLKLPPREGESHVDAILRRACEVQGSDDFDDDYSLVCLKLPE
jgi:phosphoserine phosphatase RsbU/P